MASGTERCAVSPRIDHGEISLEAAILVLGVGGSIAATAAAAFLVPRFEAPAPAGAASPSAEASSPFGG